MNKLPYFIAAFFLFCQFFAIEKVLAVEIVSQTQDYSASLNVWQMIQELGANLSGKVTTFTFRVSTSRSHLDQFDYTVGNSRIYDKSNNNSYILSCVPTGSNPDDRLKGLTFNKTGVADGYEDVTIDFSCRDYSFIPGHKYLMLISNANIGNSGSGLILFGASSYAGKPSLDYFADGGLRYANGNIYDYSNNSGSCDPVAYQWNGTDPYHNGCYVWTTARDDIYFILSNSDPPPKTPVIFIPGIGGSEFKASQDIIWSASDGHGGTFSHAYGKDEKIWVNDAQAQKLGDDDYFDVLRLKNDGVTSEAELSLTGSLTSFGYGDIESFFTGLGHEKGKNFFVFPYDWRKDVKEAKDKLDSLIEEAKTKSGKTQVNLVVHSMGGLVARYYILDSSKAAKVNKLIELGVPHLGVVDALKTLRYGSWLGYDFHLFTLGIPPSETKDGAQNMPSIFELLPSSKYYDFYNNSTQDLLFPIRDDRDIDNNKEIGPLNFNQTKSHLSNLGHNMTVFGMGEAFHNTVGPLLNNTNGVKLYLIAGSNQPTLGQLHETWWVTWPINLISKTEEVFINGDETVPLYSATLKNDSLDLSGGGKIYYVEQKHNDLVKKDGIAMQTVKAILQDESLPVEVKSEKIDLEGQQLSLDDGELELFDDEGKHTGIKDDGEIETNIPETFYSTSGKTKHAFVKNKAKKVKVKITRKSKTSSDPKTTNLKMRHYKQDKVSKTATYQEIKVDLASKVEFDIDPSIDTSPSLNLYPDLSKSESEIFLATSEIEGAAALDQTSPSTQIKLDGSKNSEGRYTSNVTITLTGSDLDSGLLKTEYSLDNGQTVKIYSTAFTVSTPGKYTLQVKSVDKLGNEEIPQTVNFEIAQILSGSSSGTSTSSSGNTSSISSQSTSEESLRNTSEVTLSEVERGSSEVDKSQLDEGTILGEQKADNSTSLSLSGVLKITGVLTALLVLGLAFSFFKKSPK